MKKLALFLSLCLLAGALSACGAAKSEQPAPTPAQTAAPTPVPAPAQTPAAETPNQPAPETPSAPEETPAPETPPEAPTNERLETAKTFIGKTTPELFAVIGEPESSDYAPSCLGPGDDGNLYYDGFTVYTYRENGEETIRIVE